MYNVRDIEAYMPTFGYISADSGRFKILAQLNIFIYIKVYSEPMNVIQEHSGANQEQFVYILNII